MSKKMITFALFYSIYFFTHYVFNIREEAGNLWAVW
jgi:hypothetical protein